MSTHESTLKKIAPDALAALLAGHGELALLDARDEAVFARAHLLFGVLLPWSRLEERVAMLVPRLGTPIVITSSVADGVAARAARKLLELGYDDVSILDGGIEAWEKAGFRLFGGIHVPSKAFGELVEQHCATPHIEAAELKALLDTNADIAVFDSRPAHEYLRMNIPTARNCPGAELLYRLSDAVRSADTLVVVNCAGRTRSIIGAQSLINAGFPNRVVALKNGTMGWHLAGMALESGNSNLLPAPGALALQAAARMASEVRVRFRIRQIDAAELSRLRGETATRTLYVFDVRSPEEFEAGHLAGSHHAPGGQLVQTTDLYMGTRNARVVLVDSDNVRATITASWLLQLGWLDVCVLRADDSALLFEERGPMQAAWPAVRNTCAEITPSALRDGLDTGHVHLLDLALSEVYGAAHIPGARFALRSRFPASLASLAPDKTLVLTSEDSRLAHAAAADAKLAFRGPVSVLAGGNLAWDAAGYERVSGFDAALDAADDVWQIPYLRGPDAMREYLSWETGLLARLTNEPGVRFQVAVQASQRAADSSKHTIHTEVTGSGEFGTAAAMPSTARLPDYPVLAPIVARWSPRAMSGEPLSDIELMTLFEAARWAPSSNNAQPWRFVYAREGTVHWAAFLDLLNDGNRRWAARGTVLVMVLSIHRNPRDGKALRTRSYDCGAAWQNLALQGSALGLVVHGMQGFDYERAALLLKIPADTSIEAMFVAGRPGPSDMLPTDLQVREQPSQRRPVSELAFEGVLPDPLP